MYIIYLMKASEKDCLELEGRVRELEQVLKQEEFQLNSLQEKFDKNREKLKMKENQYNDVVKEQVSAGKF